MVSKLYNEVQDWSEKLSTRLAAGRHRRVHTLCSNAQFVKEYEHRRPNAQRLPLLSRFRPIVAKQH